MLKGIRMNERQENLLKSIIKEHFKQAQPIGSKLLEEKGRFQLSSATIRNIMAELEEAGFIYQPHTSAGRVPTEKAYRYFLTDYFSGSLSSKEQSQLLSCLENNKNQPQDCLIKELAKQIAVLSTAAVVVGFSPNSFYYTGLSYLFAQPEFKDPDLVYDLSRVIDHLDKVMSQLFDSISQPQIYIGSDNPFGAECSVVVGPWQAKQARGIMGLLGPMRMDYGKNIGLLNFVRVLK